jgi:hypothetical protein
VKRCRAWLTAKRVHLILLWVWLILAVPSVTHWRNSVPWLVFVSVYANAASHWSGYEGARAEEAVNSDE